VVACVLCFFTHSNTQTHTHTLTQVADAAAAAAFASAEAATATAAAAAAGDAFKGDLNGDIADLKAAVSTAASASSVADAERLAAAAAAAKANAAVEMLLSAISILEKDGAFCLTYFCVVCCVSFSLFRSVFVLRQMRPLRQMQSAWQRRRRRQRQMRPSRRNGQRFLFSRVANTYFLSCTLIHKHTLIVLIFFILLYNSS
jgi:hypothetical protein